MVHTLSDMKTYVLETWNDSFFKPLYKTYMCLADSPIPICLRTYRSQTLAGSRKTLHQLQETGTYADSVGPNIINFLSNLSYFMKLGTSTTHFKWKQKFKYGWRVRLSSENATAAPRTFWAINLLEFFKLCISSTLMLLVKKLHNMQINAVIHIIWWWLMTHTNIIHF